MPKHAISADKKLAYKALPGVISAAIEMYVVYNAYSKGEPVGESRPSGVSSESDKLKLGPCPPNWLLTLTVTLYHRKGNVEY